MLSPKQLEPISYIYQDNEVSLLEYGEDCFTGRYKPYLLAPHMWQGFRKFSHLQMPI